MAIKMELLQQYLKGETCVEIWKTIRRLGKKPNRTNRTVYVIKQYTGAKLTSENITVDRVKVDMFKEKLVAKGFRSVLK